MFYIGDFVVFLKTQFFKTDFKQIFLTTTVVVGGRSQMAQAQELANRPHIIVATPGRLADHVESDPTGNARLFRTIRFLVLDEADRLLDGQYALQVFHLTFFSYS